MTAAAAETRHHDFLTFAPRLIRAHEPTDHSRLKENQVDRVYHDCGACRNPAQARAERAELAGAPLSIDDDAATRRDLRPQPIGMPAEDHNGWLQARAVVHCDFERAAAGKTGQAGRKSEPWRGAGREEYGIDSGPGHRNGARRHYK